MAFFNSAVTVLQTLVIALGAGLGIWGVINLLEGYGNDNPGAKSQGMKQLMAGAGVAVVGMVNHRGNHTLHCLRLLFLHKYNRKIGQITYHDGRRDARSLDSNNLVVLDVLEKAHEFLS